MKNTTVKHHTIENSEGMNNDGRYSLSYTTCPEKSFIVKPDEGKIDYDNLKEKNI